MAALPIESGLETGGARSTPVRPACRSSGSASGLQMLCRGSEENPDVKGSGAFDADVVGPHPRQREAAADAVERPRRHRAGPPAVRSVSARGPGRTTVPPFAPGPELEPSIGTCDYGGTVRRPPSGPGSGGRPCSSIPRSRVMAGLRVARELRELGGGARWTSTRPSICAADGACGCTRATTNVRPTTATTRSARPKAFADAGAPWIHVVDLDAARSGEAAQPRRDRRDGGRRKGRRPGAVGGRRARHRNASAAALAQAGVARVVIGTVERSSNPTLVARVAARQPVAVGLDARGRDVAVRGWEQASGRETCSTWRSSSSTPGVEALIVTEIGRDGTRRPRLDGLVGRPRARQARRDRVGWCGRVRRPDCARRSRGGWAQPRRCDHGSSSVRGHVHVERGARSPWSQLVDRLSL